MFWLKGAKSLLPSQATRWGIAIVLILFFLVPALDGEGISKQLEVFSEKNSNAKADPDTKASKRRNNGSHQPCCLINESYPMGLDHLRAIAYGRCDHPISLRVEKNGKPVEGREVLFRVVEAPGGRIDQKWLSAEKVFTDAQGRVQIEFQALGGKGMYVVEALLEGSVEHADPIPVRINAVPGNWQLLLVIGLIGGLALFLFGMDIAGRALQKAAGDRFRSLLGALTRNSWIGALLGIVVTFMLQSSSASTVMLVGLVSATLLNLAQAIGVIIGAKIGTTLTVQIIAFDISQYALAIVALGLVIRVLAKYKQFKRIGSVIVGFGFIFFGMGSMAQAMEPLRSDPDFTRMMLTLGSQPVLAAGFALLFTAVIQSASATIGVAMALASQGMLTLEACLPISMGASVGTCATALLASLSANRAGKQVAVAHLLFSFMALLLFLPLLSPLLDLTRGISWLMGGESVVRQVAHGFTLFSVLAGLIFLPFTKWLAILTVKLVPDDPKAVAFAPKFIQQNSVDFPAVAIEEALHEALHMGKLVREQISGVAMLIERPSERQCYEMAMKDDQIDALERAIRPFLARCGQNEMDESLASRERAIVYVADTLESIGDMIVRSLLHAIEKMAEKKISFSREGKRELLGYVASVVTRFDILVEVVKSGDKAKADEIIEVDGMLEWSARKLRASHLERLHKGVNESIESSEAHLSVTSCLLNINRRLTDIARIVRDELS